MTFFAVNHGDLGRSALNRASKQIDWEILAQENSKFAE